MPMPKKREDEKLGRPNGAAQHVDKVEFELELEFPPADSMWEPIALYAWESYKKSPVLRFATQTDIAFAWAACDALSRAVERGSATTIMAAESMMKSALFTEQARRNARIELTRKAPEPDSQIEDNVAEFRKRRNAS